MPKNMWIRWIKISIRIRNTAPKYTLTSSDLNLMIMKLEAEVKVLSLRLSEPERVAMLVAASSVRPPPRICTVSKIFSVSKSENWTEKKRHFRQVGELDTGEKSIIRTSIYDSDQHSELRFGVTKFETKKVPTKFKEQLGTFWRL